MVQRKCNNCNTKLENRWQLKYCSNKCQLVHQHKAHVQKWKEGDIVVNTKNISKCYNDIRKWWFSNISNT